MVDLDRYATLERTATKLDGLYNRNEFPHSYNSVKIPTLQYKKGVKDLWETHWNQPAADELKAFKIRLLTGERMFISKQLDRVKAATDERTVVQQWFELLSARFNEQAKSGALLEFKEEVDKDGVKTVKLDDSLFNPAQDEFQALQVDLPSYLRKVFDLKRDQIERAASAIAKKDGKRQEKSQLDVEMTDVASANSPEVRMTINQLVQKQVALALKNKVQSLAPSSSKVSEEGTSRFRRISHSTIEPAPQGEAATEEEVPQQRWETQNNPLRQAAGYAVEEAEEASKSSCWRVVRAQEEWARREGKRESQRVVDGILRKPWTFAVPSSYPDEILSLPRSIQFTTLLTRAPVQTLEANEFRSLVHVQPGVDVPVAIQHDLSASLKFMFETKIDGTLIQNAYTDLVRRTRWKWFFMGKAGSDYDPDYEVTTDSDSKKKHEPPDVPLHIERGLTAGQAYIDQVVKSIPESKRKAANRMAVNTKRAREFMVSNNLIVTSTDKNLGVAVFKRDWIKSQADTLFGNPDDYFEPPIWETVEYLSNIATAIEELCDEYLLDQHQLSKFLSHNLPPPEERSEWSSWRNFVPEAYAIPKIHKNPWKGRPICPGYCLPQNAASKCLSKLTRPFIDNLPWVIQGSKDFVRKLKDVKIPEGKKAWIVSADVVNFYPSVDMEELIKILNLYANDILVPAEIQKGEYPESERFRRLDYYERLFSIALKEPVMTYIDKILVQRKGLPMGAAGSPDAANMYGAYHEHVWMDRVQQSDDILFYGRYLDDIFTMVLSDTADDATAKVSFINLGGVNLLWEPPSQQVNFLDLNVQIEEDGRITHTPFVKAMSHRERIPWSSAHPLDVKKGTFSSEISRLATLSSERSDYLNQCTEAVNMYIGRGYPPKLATSWLKRQQELRWENRLSVQQDVEDPARTLFTLKTQFNEAWKYFNVSELESKIKAQWELGLKTDIVLGKRKKFPAPSGAVKRVKLSTSRPPGGGQSRLSFALDDEAGLAFDPVLGRVTQSTAGLVADQDVRKWTSTWMDTGKFLVSRAKTTQLWDLTRTWNKQIWTNYLQETGARRPFEDGYEGVILPNEEEQ
jgi:hypothetical protein